MYLEVEYSLSKFKYFALYNNTKEVLISGIMLYFHNIFYFLTFSNNIKIFYCGQGVFFLNI